MLKWWQRLFISLNYFTMFLKPFSEQPVRFNRAIASGSCPALSWQLTMRLAGHELEFSHNEHNASVIQLVSNNTKFIEMSTPKPIFYQILLFCSQINMPFEQFNLELLSWLSTYKQVAKSYLASLRSWKNTLWAWFRYRCQKMEQPCLFEWGVPC